MVLKIRDQNQVLCLARQFLGSENSKAFREVFNKYVTKTPYGHLLLDLSVNKPDIFTMRTNIHTNGGEKVITF